MSQKLRPSQASGDSPRIEFSFMDLSANQVFQKNFAMTFNNSDMRSYFLIRYRFPSVRIQSRISWCCGVGRGDPSWWM